MYIKKEIRSNNVIIMWCTVCLFVTSSTTVDTFYGEETGSGAYRDRFRFYSFQMCFLIFPPSPCLFRVAIGCNCVYTLCHSDLIKQTDFV